MSRTTEFKIRIVAGGSVSLGVGVEAMTMDIWDAANDQLCTYEFRGFSFGRGTPIAISLRGPWNDLRTPTPMSCGDFGGLASFGTVFVMDKSVNVLRIEPLRGFPVEIVPFITGWSLGFGAAVGGGAFSRIFPVIGASKAPWPHEVQ